MQKYENATSREEIVETTSRRYVLLCLIMSIKNLNFVVLKFKIINNVLFSGIDISITGIKNVYASEA